MKKLSLLFIGLIYMPVIQAQDINDALRYSTGEIEGSARFKALSGAFGALGGDLSAVSINPAGSAIFTTSHASVTLSSFNNDNETSYFNGRGISDNSDINLSQGGGVFVFRNTNENSPWKKFTLGIAFDTTKNYDDSWFASGTNNQNSIDSYFLNLTNQQDIAFGVLKLQPGKFLEEAYADIGANFGFNYQQVFLAYWAGIIDPQNLDDTTNDDNLIYNSNIFPATSFNQTQSVSSTGYNGKIAFNIATQYNDNLYIGLNLNSHFINYDSFTRFTENNNNTTATVNSLAFENTLNTQGTGFSFQLGSILKVTNELRLGLTYDSPTWLTIDEELIQGINSNNADQDISFVSDIINVFPSFKLKTPSKVTGSLAYVFGKQGLISFDYSRKNYGNTELRPTSDPQFANENNIMNDLLTTTSTYKIGGEFKAKQFSFRGGYRYEESPYKDGITVGDLTGYSLGLGYDFGNTKLDLTYAQSQRESSYQFFNTGLTDVARIDNTNSNITLTLGFQL